MTSLQRLPFAIRWLALGVILAGLTLGIVALWIGLFGEPYTGWDWTILSFVLVIAETLALGGLAAANGPYEARQRRWSMDDFAQDAYATQFRLDLAANEQNAPRRLFIDSRFVYMAIPASIAALALGIVLSQAGDATSTPPISDVQALEISAEAIRPDSSRSNIPRLADSTITTVAEAQDRYPQNTSVMSLPADRRIFLISYDYDSKTDDHPNLRAGPVVLVDAINGEVLALIRPE